MVKPFQRMGQLSAQLILRYYILALLAFAAYRAANLHARFFVGVIWSDAEGYYLYLPAIFINAGFEDLSTRTGEVQFPLVEGTNKRFTKYTCGVAMLQMPFFLAAHQLAKWNSQPLDGISPYYVYGLQIAALLYGFLGLLVLKRMLLRYVNPWIGFFVIVGLFFGTNFFHYMVQEPAMSHIYSFLLFGLFVYYTPRFYEQADWRIFTIMGLLLGLITLIRPTNIVIVLYLLFYDVTSQTAFRERMKFIGKHFLILLVAPLASFVVFIPQFIYWKYVSGDWLMYSYGDEGFTNWADPKFREVLFDIKNGWLLFSPLVCLPLLGCLLGSWKNSFNIRTITIIVLITFYVFSSWWCWWFGGAFGQRGFVEYYVLLAIPFAYLSHLIFQKLHWIFAIPYILLWLVLTYYGYMLMVHFTGPHYVWYEWELVVQWMKEFKFDVEL
jgi:hypothetical protein